MYTLGIPDRQKRRALGYLKYNWIDFEEHPSSEGFIELRFPEISEEHFRSISNQLKQQGVTLIGVDTQLTERKIMKLTDLIKEDHVEGMPNKDNVIDILRNMVRKWSTTTYINDKERGDDFFLDIRELIEDFEEEQTINYPTHLQNPNLRTTSLQEQKFRALVKKQIRKKLKEAYGDNFLGDDEKIDPTFYEDNYALDENDVREIIEAGKEHREFGESRRFAVDVIIDIIIPRGINTEADIKLAEKIANWYAGDFQHGNSWIGTAEERRL